MCICREDRTSYLGGGRSSSSTAAAAEVIRVPFIRSRDVTLGKISLGDGIHDSLSTSVAWRDGARATGNEQTLTSQDIGCNRNRTNSPKPTITTIFCRSHQVHLTSVIHPTYR